MGRVNIYVKYFTLVQKNAPRGEINKFKILNNSGKSGNSTNDWNVPTMSVMVFIFYGRWTSELTTNWKLSLNKGECKLWKKIGYYI